MKKDNLVVYVDRMDANQILAMGIIVFDPPPNDDSYVTVTPIGKPQGWCQSVAVQDIVKVVA